MESLRSDLVESTAFPIKSYIIFLFRLLAYSLIMYAIYYYWQKTIPAKFYYSSVIYLFILFIISGAAFQLGLLLSGKKGSRSFVTFYMAGTAIKLFLYTGIIIIYSLLNPENATGFILNFFIVYLLYAAFEVAHAYRYFSRSSVPSSTSLDNSRTDV